VTGVARSEEDFVEDRSPALILTEPFARAYGEQVAHVVPTMAIRADPDRVDAVAAQLRPILDAYKMDVFPAEPTDVAVGPSISVEVTTLGIAALITALAGLVVVAQATGRQVVAIGEQQHVRAALGMTRDARTAGAWLAVAPAVVVGALAAPVLAWAVSGLFPRGIAREAEPQPGLRVDAVALAAGALATFVVVAAVLWIVALLDARSPRPVRPGRSLLSGALLARPSMWLGASFATSPVGRGRRLPLVAGTAMLGVALGVGALFVVATIESSRTHLESSPRLYGSPTGFVMPTNGQVGIPEAIAAVLATDGVDALTERLVINDDELEATGPGGSRQVEPMAYQALKGGALPPLVSGRFPQGPDEVALGRGTARDLGAGLGDTVHIPSFDGSTAVDLTVTGLVLPGGTQDQSKAFIVSTTTLGTLLCDGGPLDTCNLSVDLFADAPTTPAGTALLDIGFEPAPVPPSVDRIGQAGALPWYLAGFLCLLGAAGLLHELVTTVRRRRHDLAVTRALGLTANRAASAVTWQAVLTALAGALLGLLLGALIGPIVWTRIADDLGVLDSTALPPVWLAALLVLAVLAVAYTVALPPRWRAKRLPMGKILRSE
jgi:ABC-type lipoprotein release transport system permease subunit